MRIFTVVLIILRNIELALRDLLGLELRPYKILLELTDYCNSKCKTCYIWKNTEEKKNQLNPAELESILKEYGSNLLWIALGGGEVTLYQEFDKLIEIVKGHCPNLRVVTFTSNALKPEIVLECATKIKECGMDLFVTISLDGDKKTHDEIRGVKGNFDLAQKAMRLLKERRIWAHFGLTVSGLNSGFILKNLPQYMKEIRAFNFEHSGGIYKTDTKVDRLNIIESIKKIKLLYKIGQLAEVVEYIYIALAQKFFESGSSKVPVPCEVLATSLHIRPNGDISPCMYLPSIGNIKNSQIGTVLKSAQTKQLRARALAAQCNKCWMNCYAPHSIMRHPLLALKSLWMT